MSDKTLPSDLVARCRAVAESRFDFDDFNRPYLGSEDMRGLVVAIVAEALAWLRGPNQELTAVLADAFLRFDRECDSAEQSADLALYELLDAISRGDDGA